MELRQENTVMCKDETDAILTQVDEIQEDTQDYEVPEVKNVSCE